LLFLNTILTKKEENIIIKEAAMIRIRKIFAGILAVSGLVAGSLFAARLMLINGAGATFPYPLYSKWFYEYTHVDPTVNFNYQAIGSGGGIRQLMEGTVDFGASDAALTDAQIKEAKQEIFHIPMVAGAVAIVYNLPGVTGTLRLTPETLSDIYLGKIRRWNDPKLAGLNPQLSGVSENIIVCYRSDGSGTTSIFTSYLTNVSAEWKKRVGSGTSANWPAGLGGKGNPGVAGLVKQNKGGIGYVELAYAVQNKLAFAALKNKSGNFVEPSLESTSKALAGIMENMPSDFRVSVVNAPGKDSYPIAGITWILVYKNLPDRAKGEKLVQFLKWAVTDGQKYAAALDYAPLPPAFAKRVLEKISQIRY
jgi:phosphate transport system substrate-binding protein